MYKKICRICGRDFEAVNSIYCCCSKECRKINKAIHQRKYLDKNRKEINRKQNELYKINHQKDLLENPRKCAVCGASLPDRRQTFCIDCLLRDFKYNYSPKAYDRLYLRGYTKKEILLEIDMKGI